MNALQRSASDKDWPAQSLGRSLSAHRLIEEGLPVRLIATPRVDFKTCDIDEAIGDVVARNHDKFDNFPVTEGSEKKRILGLIDVTAFRNGEAPSGHVHEKVTRLTESTLIGADASIIAFMRDPGPHGCRLVVSGSEISGLVSLSDLQKLPVRAALFGMVTHLEMVMADTIRRTYVKKEDWLGQLSANRQDKIRSEIKKSWKNDGFVDDLLFAQFADKISIIKKSKGFSESKKCFEDEMKRIQSLRNLVAHANDYASTPKAALDVCDIVRSTEKWIYWLDSWQRPAEAK